MKNKTLFHYGKFRIYMYLCVQLVYLLHNGTSTGYLMIQNLLCLRVSAVWSNDWNFGKFKMQKSYNLITLQSQINVMCICNELWLIDYLYLVSCLRIVRSYRDSPIAGGGFRSVGVWIVPSLLVVSVAYIGHILHMYIVAYGRYVKIHSPWQFVWTTLCFQKICTTLTYIYFR